jgi:hypothetical protein
MITGGRLLILFVLMGNVVYPSLQGQTKLWGSESCHISSYEQLLNTCMELWTYLDLVRAICTTPEQREDICRDLTTMIRDMHKQFLAFEHVCHARTYDEQKALVDNLETIQKSFMALFCDTPADYYKESVLLLSCLVSKLKAPNNITTNSTTNSMS